MSSNDFLKKISRFIEAHHLLKKDGKYLLGVSGGADSVALLMVLQALEYQVEVVHCNFHLRGAESDRDELFCKSLCEKHGISFHRKDFDTRVYAAKHKISIEMAARTLRYEYFEELRKQLKFDGVCVAHHRNDSVETVIMNLIRGTGIHGLTGISPRNGKVLRPLLCVYREDIESFLEESRQEYVTDSSNFIDNVVRNQIRLDLLPLMQKINPSVNESIAKTAERLNEIAHIYNEFMEEKVSRIEKIENQVSKISIQQIDSEPFLFCLLKKYTFTPKQIEQIYASLRANTGKVFISDTHELLFDRDYILIRPKKYEQSNQLEIPSLGTYSYSTDNSFVFGEEQFFPNVTLDRGGREVCLDRDLVAFPLTIRRVEEGDRFVPFGMCGSKLLSDYMTDCKMSLFEKQSQMVITDAGGQIVWVVNRRLDQRFAVTDKTKALLTISCLSNG